MHPEVDTASSFTCTAPSTTAMQHSIDSGLWTATGAGTMLGDSATGRVDCG